MRVAVLGVLLAAVAVLTVGCGEAQPPAPVPTSTAAVMDGRGLYASHCARCHGGDLKGTTQGPPFLDAMYAPGHHSDASFFLAVKNGVKPHHWNFGPMPPVEGLTDAQIAQIVAFIREDQRAVGIR